MDILTIESQAHGEIRESLALFKKSKSYFSDADIEKFQMFLNDNVKDHFKFEEE